MSDDRFVEIIFLHYSSLNFIPRLSRQSNVQIIRISCVKTFSVCSASVSLRDVGVRFFCIRNFYMAFTHCSVSVDVCIVIGKTVCVFLQLRDWSAASIFEANSPFDSSGGDKYIH